jgi:hypothetical protein
MSFNLEIPEQCQETVDNKGCPFEYDGIYCNAYQKPLRLLESEDKPCWCRAKQAVVIE